MKAVLVEDDHLQLGPLQRELGMAFPGSAFTLIRTESEFRDRIDEIVKLEPDIIVMDVMLRWTNPTIDMAEAAPPDDVGREGYYRAGFRCRRLITERRPDISVILYSVLDQEDVAKELEQRDHSNAVYVRKDTDASSLISSIKGVLAAKIHQESR